MAAQRHHDLSALLSNSNSNSGYFTSADFYRNHVALNQRDSSTHSLNSYDRVNFDTKTNSSGVDIVSANSSTLGPQTVRRLDMDSSLGAAGLSATRTVQNDASFTNLYPAPFLPGDAVSRDSQFNPNSRMFNAFQPSTRSANVSNDNSYVAPVWIAPTPSKSNTNDSRTFESTGTFDAPRSLHQSPAKPKTISNYEYAAVSNHSHVIPSVPIPAVEPTSTRVEPERPVDPAQAVRDQHIQALVQCRTDLAQRELQLIEMRAAHLKYAQQSKESQEKWERAVSERDELLRAKDRSIRDMRRELESRRVEYSSRDSELETLKELQKQNAELIESLRAAELLSAQRASEIDRLKAKIETDASDAGRELISVRSHLSECKSQLAELHQQLDARQQSEASVAQNMRQTHTEIDMLTQRFVAEREQWQSTNERLALDLDAARTAWQEEKNINSELHSAISELQSSVQRRNQDFAALHKTIEEIKQERAASGDAQAQLSKALVANAATEQELSAQRLHVTALDEALKATRAELEQSKARARSLESAAAEGIEAKKAFEKSEADAAAARRLNDRLQRDLEDLTTVSTRFQREQARAAQVALAAQGQAAQLQQELSLAQHTIAAYQTASEQTQSSNVRQPRVVVPPPRATTAELGTSTTPERPKVESVRPGGLMSPATRRRHDALVESTLAFSSEEDLLDQSAFATNLLQTPTASNTGSHNMETATSPELMAPAIPREWIALLVQLYRDIHALAKFLQARADGKDLDIAGLFTIQDVPKPYELSLLGLSESATSPSSITIALRSLRTELRTAMQTLADECAKSFSEGCAMQ